MDKVQKCYNSNRYCSVPQCKSRCSREISLMKFPKDKKLKEKWAHALKIGKKISEYMLVCSLHFLPHDFFLPGIPTKRRCLKKGAVPSQNSPQTSFKSAINSKLVEDRAVRLKNRKSKITILQNEQPDVKLNDKADEVNSAKEELRTLEESVNRCFEKFVETNTNKSYADATCQADAMEVVHQNLSILDFIKTNKQLNAFTGLATFKLFNDIVKGVELVENLDSSEKFKISVLHRVALTFIKLKLNLSFICISVLFKININSCKNYFLKTLESLTVLLQRVIRFPDKEEILKNLPVVFNKYKNTRIILDCTEISIEQFKCLNCRIKTYSQYKGTHTVKFLIGCTPSGMISFVSKAYGGRTSDKEIFLQSNILEKCISNVDAIMVDKGFKIEAECAHYNIKLIRPPFLKDKKQLSSSEAAETACIASARVHIERCIQRLKLFKILHIKISQNLVPYISDIMVVISGIVNLSLPILSEDKF